TDGHAVGPLSTAPATTGPVVTGPGSGPVSTGPGSNPGAVDRGTGASPAADRTPRTAWTGWTGWTAWPAGEGAGPGGGRIVRVLGGGRGGPRCRERWRHWCAVVRQQAHHGRPP